MNKKSNMRQVITRPRPGSCEMSHDHMHWSHDQKKKKSIKSKIYVMMESISIHREHLGTEGGIITLVLLFHLSLNTYFYNTT